MKVKIAILAFIMAIVFSCSAAEGATEDIMEGMWKKLSRGVVNVATGWLELPVQVVRGYKKAGEEEAGKNWVGALGGIFKGIGCAIGRTAWGAVELVGFWTVNPEDNEGVGMHLDAEYVWQEGRKDAYGIFYDKEKDVGPLGEKLLRGLGNTIFGFAELPGQIGKGVENKYMDFGITKGLWFWASREVYGIADLLTLIFPTPEDNPGYYFEEEYPWDALADVMEQ